MEEISGIITSVSQYRENDAIITILNENGLDSAKIRAFSGKNSHLHSIIAPLNEVKLETYKGGQKYKSVRDGAIIKRFFQPQIEDGFQILSLVEVLKELVYKFPVVDDFTKNYQLLKLTVQNFSKDNAEICVLSYIIILIKLLGYDFKNELNLTDDFECLMNELLSKRYKELLNFDYKNIKMSRLIVFFLEMIEKYSETKIISKNLI